MKPIVARLLAATAAIGGYAVNAISNDDMHFMMGR